MTKRKKKILFGSLATVVSIGVGAAIVAPMMLNYDKNINQFERKRNYLDSNSAVVETLKDKNYIKIGESLAKKFDKNYILEIKKISVIEYDSASMEFKLNNNVNLIISIDLSNKIVNNIYLKNSNGVVVSIEKRKTDNGLEYVSKGKIVEQNSVILATNAELRKITGNFSNAVVFKRMVKQFTDYKTKKGNVLTDPSKDKELIPDTTLTGSDKRDYDKQLAEYLKERKAFFDYKMTPKPTLESIKNDIDAIEKIFRRASDAKFFLKGATLNNI